ncbi:MAG: hypothetical protein VX160_02195, partial [Actinomycetota bacterium]|nr:hypothetical protein [Actinomycetota bacterium]
MIVIIIHSRWSHSQGFTKSKFLENNTFVHMSLEPLTKRQQEQIVENRLGRDAVKLVRQHIKKLVDFEGATICGNPLMLSMVISIFQANGAEDFPKTRFELYQSAVSTMLTRLDFKDIAQRSQAQGQHVQCLLAEIAADRQQARDKDITEEHVGQVIAAHGHEKEMYPLADAWEQVKAQVLQGKLPLLSCLEPSPLKLRFAHLSLQEFLCVEKWLAMVDAGKAYDAVLPPLSTMLNDGWWRNSLTMACEGHAELAAELFGGSIKLSGLKGETPMSMLPELIREFRPGTRSLRLRFVTARAVLMFTDDSLHSSDNKLSGEIPETFFDWLCSLDKFDLKNNPGISQETLAGHLACRLTNLKDQTEIAASGKSLKGACACTISS